MASFNNTRQLTSRLFRVLIVAILGWVSFTVEGHNHRSDYLRNDGKNEDHHRRHHHHHHHHGRHLQHQGLSRCGTVDQTIQQMLQVEEDVKQWRQVNGCTKQSCPLIEKKQQQQKTTISTYWHNIQTSSGTNGATETMITESMTVLNNAYSSAGFSFNLVSTTTTANDNYYSASFASSEQDDMKSSLRQGDASTLNIYSNGIDVLYGMLGYAAFPIDYTFNPTNDGVVIGSQTSPGGSIFPYNEGDTLVHEVGHWLGLYHVFQSGCFGCGDFVDDTPCQSTATSGCPANQDSCAGAGVDSVTNFMDYSTDACMTQFTSGQITRMAEQWNTYRASGGRFAPATPPNYLGYVETFVSGFLASVKASFQPDT